MLNRLPRQFPPLWLMLEDIGKPTPHELAKTFNVSERTVRQWIAKDTAPMPVLWAIFFLTRWGFSLVEAEAHNALTMQARTVAAQRLELEALRNELRRLGQIADFGSANDPAPGVLLPSPVAVVAPRAPAARARTEETQRQPGRVKGKR